MTTTVKTRRISLDRTPWVWSGIGAVVLWIIIGIVGDGSMFSTLQASLQTGAALVLVGLGQLVVVASGNGNIDLSMPNVMTLGSLVAFSVADGHNDRILVGLAAGIAVGIAVGLVNSFTIFVLGIPPIVATLAVGLIVQTGILLQATDFDAEAPPALTSLVSGRVLGVPTMAIIAVLVTIVAAIVLQRGTFGRKVFALGQSWKATERSGLPTTATATVCYLISGVLAAVAGTMLAAFTGPSISLGAPYLLTSVAVVVLGGTLISGGRASVAGLWTAMLMLTFIITLVYVLKWSVAVQEIFEGLVILAVLSLAGKSRRA